MKKLLLIILLIFSINISLAEDNSWSWNSILEQFNEKRKEIYDITDTPEEQKNLEKIENTLEDIGIKKDFNKQTLDSVNTELNKIKQTINENTQKIQVLSNKSKGSSENIIKVTELEKINLKLKQEIAFKENMIKDLQSTISSYEILEKKYELLLDQYTDTKKQIKKEKSNVALWNLFYFLLIIGIAGIIYYTKWFLLKKYPEKYEKHFLYFDLAYGILLIIVLVSYTFSIFPQLYLVLLFVAWSLVLVLWHLISAFVSSFLIFRKYKIWEIIKIWDETWQIVKLSPTYTTIRISNDYWFLTNRFLNISNDSLLKDKIVEIEQANIRWHDFKVIFPMKKWINFLQIVESIENDILLKYTFPRTDKLDKKDKDSYKISFSQSKSEEIEVKFYWRADMVASRKLEKKILELIKNYLDNLD